MLSSLPTKMGQYFTWFNVDSYEAVVTGKWGEDIGTDVNMLYRLLAPDSLDIEELIKKCHDDTERCAEESAGLGDWIGEHLVYMGDSTEALPPGLVKHPIAQEMKDCLAEGHDTEGGDTEGNCNEGRDTEGHCDEGRDTEGGDTEGHCKEGCDTEGRDGKSESTIAPFDFLDYQCDMSPRRPGWIGKECVKKNQTWVLRNLSKNLCVQAKDEGKGPYFAHLHSELEEIQPGFYQVLMCYASWSSGGSMEPDGYPGRTAEIGEWAGDRFDITTIDKAQDDTGNMLGDWKDVTEEVTGYVNAVLGICFR